MLERSRFNPACITVYNIYCSSCPAPGLTLPIRSTLGTCTLYTRRKPGLAPRVYRIQFACRSAGLPRPGSVGATRGLDTRDIHVVIPV